MSLVWRCAAAQSTAEHWNSGSGFSKSETDDLGFVETLLDQLGETRNIDTDRVYAIGMSNGGMMSYLLACRLSQRIAAIASVTGSMTVDSENCIANRPVPVMQIHGVEDDVVLGGPGRAGDLADRVERFCDFGQGGGAGDVWP